VKRELAISDSFALPLDAVTNTFVVLAMITGGR